jgi:hypothetical protein
MTSRYLLAPLSLKVPSLVTTVNLKSKSPYVLSEGPELVQLKGMVNSNAHRPFNRPLTLEGE